MRKLEKAAAKANGLSRMCGKCEFAQKRDTSACYICSMAFKEGFVKGYRKAVNDRRPKTFEGYQKK